MEVLVRHSKRRFSRTIAIVLVLVVGTGVFAAIKKIRWTSKPAVPLVVTQKNIPALPASVGPAPSVAPAKVQVAQAPGKSAKSTIAKGNAPTSRPVLLDVAPAPKPAANLPISGHPLADAKARFDAGDLIAARSVLNDAVLADKLGADREAGKELLGKIAQQVVFGRRIFKDDPFSFSYVLQPGDRLQKVAATNNVTWELVCRINGISDPKKIRAMQTIKIVKGPFHAVITKKKFAMDLYLGSAGGAGSVYLTTYPVGLGKDDSTPAGTWQVAPNGKLKNPTYYSPRGEGVIQSGDPKNPLGAFWIGLLGVEGSAANKPSYGIHGTIDSASIGREESMGCIRMRNEDVALVFELLVEGKSTVVVKD